MPNNGTERGEGSVFYAPNTLVVVGLKLLNVEASVSGEVVEHLLDNFVRHRGNVRPGQGAVKSAMDGVAHAGGNDLSLDIGIVEEHIVDRLDQLDARLADIVKTAQEGADVAARGRPAMPGLALKISVQLVGMPSADSSP